MADLVHGSGGDTADRRGRAGAGGDLSAAARELAELASAALDRNDSVAFTRHLLEIYRVGDTHDIAALDDALLALDHPRAPGTSRGNAEFLAERAVIAEQRRQLSAAVSDRYLQAVTGTGLARGAGRHDPARPATTADFGGKAGTDASSSTPAEGTAAGRSRVRLGMDEAGVPLRDALASPPAGGSAAAAPRTPSSNRSRGRHGPR